MITNQMVVMPKTRSKPKKIKPFRKVPATQIKNPNPKYVYIENDKIGVKIPLVTEHGHLNGVFETPRHKIVEIRYRPIRKQYYVMIDGKWIGDASLDFGHRFVDSHWKDRGIMSELFDLIEPIPSRRRNPYPFDPATGQRKDSSSKDRFQIQIATDQKDTALFLHRRGYTPATPQSKKQLKQLNPNKRQPRQKTAGEQPMYLTKVVKPSSYHDPTKWHRIRIIGRDGKPKWLTIRMPRFSVTI